MYEPIDVVELLIRDHERLTALLRELDAEEGPAEMGLLLDCIIDGLAAHEVAEERVVFPPFHTALGVDPHQLLNRLDEHDEINLLLDEMRQLQPGCFGFTKRASALVVAVVEHFAWEEELLFPFLRATLGRRVLLELAERVRLGQLSWTRG